MTLAGLAALAAAGLVLVRPTPEPAATVPAGDGPGSLPRTATAAPPSTPAAATAAVAAVATPDALPPVPANVRVVSGQGISPLPAQATPPQRVAVPVKPKPPEPIEPRLLARAMIEDTGTVRAGNIRVRMPDLQPLAPEETCRDAVGVEWPCGRQALTAIRAFVRTHGVVCPLPKSARSGSFEVACRLGSLGFAEWAIGQGWARTPVASGPLAEAAARAKAEGRGLYRAEAPAMRPVAEIAPDLPPDPSLAPLVGAGR